MWLPSVFVASLVCYCSFPLCSVLNFIWTPVMSNSKVVKESLFQVFFLFGVVHKTPSLTLTSLTIFCLCSLLGVFFFSRHWFSFVFFSTSGGSGLDGRDGAGVLHTAVGEVPVLQQGTQRHVRVPQQTLGTAGVWWGQKGHLWNLLGELKIRNIRNIKKSKFSNEGFYRSETRKIINAVQGYQFLVFFFFPWKHVSFELLKTEI